MIHDYSLQRKNGEEEPSIIKKMRNDLEKAEKKMKRDGEKQLKKAKIPLNEC